jgi:hypothetical protein
MFPGTHQLYSKTCCLLGNSLFVAAQVLQLQLPNSNLEAVQGGECDTVGLKRQGEGIATTSISSVVDDVWLLGVFDVLWLGWCLCKHLYNKTVLEVRS